MADFLGGSWAKVCRQCYIEKGQSIRLVQEPSGNWVCPINRSHKPAVADYK